MQENRQPACFPLGRGKILSPEQSRQQSGSSAVAPALAGNTADSPAVLQILFPGGAEMSSGDKAGKPYNPGTTVQEQVSSGYIWEKLRKSPSNILPDVLSKFFSCRVDMISCSFLFSPNKGPARKFPCGDRIFYGKSLKKPPRDAQNRVYYNSTGLHS